MFVIQELPEWDEYQDDKMYFGGWHKEPKYGTMQPMWTGELDMAMKFADKDEACVLADDFSDYWAMKGISTRYTVAGLS